MNKYKGKFEELHEETLYRHQQGGFLRGDYVRIKKNALGDEKLGQFSEQLKTIVQDAIKNETVLRVSYIKSGHSEAFSGPVDAANIPSCSLWADCYVEHAPGMWHNIMTLPLAVLEKIEIEGANGFAPYNKNLVRPNTDEPGGETKELKRQTQGTGDAGGEENRTLGKKNVKLANTKEPRSGLKDIKKESNAKGFKKENELIFESYINNQSLLNENDMAYRIKDMIDQGKVDIYNHDESEVSSEYGTFEISPNSILFYNSNFQEMWDIDELLFTPLKQNNIQFKPFEDYGVEISPNDIEELIEIISRTIGSVLD